ALSPCGRPRARLLGPGQSDFGRIYIPSGKDALGSMHWNARPASVQPREEAVTDTERVGHRGERRIHRRDLRHGIPPPWVTMARRPALAAVHDHNIRESRGSPP